MFSKGRIIKEIRILLGKNSYWLSNRWIDDDNPHDIGWFEDKAYYLSDTPEIIPDNPYQVFALCSTNSDPIKKLRWINECKIVPDGAGTFVRLGVVCPAPEQYDFYVFENYPWADYIIYNIYDYDKKVWKGWKSLPSIAVDWDFAVDVVSRTCNNNP